MPYLQRLLEQAKEHSECFEVAPIDIEHIKELIDSKKKISLRVTYYEDYEPVWEEHHGEGFGVHYNSYEGDDFKSYLKDIILSGVKDLHKRGTSEVIIANYIYNGNEYLIIDVPACERYDEGITIELYDEYIPF